MQITPAEVAETLAMVSKQNLDIRTITLGINLRGCVDADVDKLATKVYDRMTSAAENLVPTAEQLEREFGIPIVNKRISVTPHRGDLRRRDRRRPHTRGRGHGPRRQGGGRRFRRRLLGARAQRAPPGRPQAHGFHPYGAGRHRPRLRLGERGQHAAGINMDAAFKMAGVIKRAAELTADKQCIGAGKLVVFCNAVEDNPFMAGAFHGSGEADEVVNVGVSGPGVVRAVLADLPKDADITTVAEAIKATAFKITRAGELAARRRAVASACSRASWTCRWPPRPPRAIPWPDPGSHRRGPVRRPRDHGGPRHAERRCEEGGVMASSSVGGLSGAFIPRVRGCRHDPRRRGRGAVHREAGGHDLRMLRGPRHDRRAGRYHPGRPSSGIIADECAIGMINNKTTAVRLIPAIGCQVGDQLDFGGLLGYAPVMPVNPYAGTVFAHRGGRMPAPLNSLKN